MDREEALKQLRDIHGYHAIEIPMWLLILLGFLVAAALVTFVYLKFFRNRKKRILTNLEKAIQDLNDLDINNLSKAFYLSYSEIVKEYLEVELDLPVIDKTVNELKPILNNEPMIRTDQAIFIMQSFGRGDLAKFAKREVSAEEKKSDKEKMIELLEEIDQAIKDQVEKEKQEKELSV